MNFPCSRSWTAYQGRQTGGKDGHSIPWKTHELRRRIDAGLFLFAAPLTAVSGGWIFQRVQMPAAWLIGPLVVSLLWGLLRPGMPGMPVSLHRLSMALLGASIAENVAPQVVITLKTRFLVPRWSLSWF